MATVLDGKATATLHSKARPIRGPIIVGIDGSPSADGAVSAAALLAERARSPVIAIGVTPPASALAPDDARTPSVDAPDLRAVLLELLLEQVSQAQPSSSAWGVEVYNGDPAAVLASVASARQARLIINGLGHHQFLGRIFGMETTLRTLRAASTPLLAVPERFDRLPRVAVFATDFGAASLNAVREALAMFDTLEEVHVIHVAPVTALGASTLTRWLMSLGETTASALTKISNGLARRGDVVVDATQRQGRSAHEILRFAREVQADLVIAGSQSAGLVQRLIVGSTAARLLRTAECAVFSSGARRYRRVA